MAVLPLRLSFEIEDRALVVGSRLGSRAENRVAERTRREIIIPAHLVPIFSMCVWTGLLMADSYQAG